MSKCNCKILKSLKRPKLTRNYMDITVWVLDPSFFVCWESGNLSLSLPEKDPPKLRASRADGQVSPWTYPISLVTDKQPPVNIVSASRGEDGGSKCHTAERAELCADLASPSTTGLRTFISFMTVPNPRLHHHTAQDLLCRTQRKFSLQHSMVRLAIQRS